jgi:predicted nucleotidyltransferase
MKHFYYFKLILLCFLVAGLSLNAQSQVEFDSTNYEELNLVEDLAKQYALLDMFSSGSGDSVGFKITQIVGGAIIEAKINATNDSLTITPQENRFGQAFITISATDTGIEETLEQQITVIISPVDDAPVVNTENLLTDIAINQTESDSIFYLDLSDRFIDVDGDDINITLSYTDKATTDNTFAAFPDSSATVQGDSVVISLAAANKFAAQITLTATSNDTLSTSTSFDIIVDDAPQLIMETIALDEDFSTTKYKLSQLITDDDDAVYSLSLFFDDYLDDDDYGANIIENDTNNLVVIRYLIDEDSLELTSKSDGFGEYILPVAITSGERSTIDSLVFDVSNVDDKPIVKNSNEDQLLPKNREFVISLNELFDDVDSDINYDDAYVKIDNSTPYEFADQEGNILALNVTSDTLFLSATDSVIVISVKGSAVVGDKSIFSVELDIDAAFPGDDPVKDIFELEVSRAVINFYVATDGDNGNDGSLSNPFATIQQAIDTAQVGDTINIATGTYTENLSINEGLIIRSELYGLGMTEAEIQQTVIKGNVNGGSVLNVYRTDGLKLYGLTIAGSGGVNTSSSSERSWGWQKDGGAAIDTLKWTEFDNYESNSRYYAVINLNDVAANDTYTVDIRREWDCGGELLFEVPLGTTGNFTSDGNNSLIFSTGTKDVYRRYNDCNTLNDAFSYLENNVPQGKLFVIESTAEFDEIYALNNGHFMIGLINRETINGYGAGVYAQNASFTFDHVIIENHQNERSEWDNAGGILIYNSRQIVIRNSIIRNNTVQNGEGVGIGAFWSDDLRITNTWVYGNEVDGDQNCTTGGLIAQGLRNLQIVNSVFADNETRCGHEVRIANVENYVINHSLISRGINYQGVENSTGLVQNSIFLGGDFNNWGSTKPSKLKIRNNLINANIYMDYEINEYGKNNILGGSPGFVDASSYDFALLSTSTLIGAGVSSSSTSDMLGNTRPSPDGSAPDIGPIENALGKPDLVFEPFTYFDAGQNSDVHMRLETSVNWRNTRSLIELVDLNHDGIDEIVFNEYLDDSNLKVMYADGSQEVIHDEWDEYTMIKPLDVNLDGYVDLVISNHNRIGYLYNDGTGIDASSFVEYTSFGFSYWDVESMSWGDMTSDGRIDAVLPDYSGIRIFDFDESEPSQQNIQLNNLDNQWLGDFGDVFLADINGDTRIDLLMERRWYNEEAKDVLVFLQNRNGFEFREDLSLIDVLEVPSNGDRTFDLQMATGDLDDDNLLDLLISYEHNEASISGYVRRFELENESWTELSTDIRIDGSTLTPFHEVFNAFINFEMIAFTDDNNMELFGFVSDDHPDNNEWERYYKPVMLELNAEQEFEIREGYFSQEIFRSGIFDAYTRPHFDFGELSGDQSYDVVVVGKKENGKNSLVAFGNTFDYSAGTVTTPPHPTRGERGEKRAMVLELDTPYFKGELGKDGACNDLLATSGHGLSDKSSAIYTGVGQKELIYYLGSGNYSVAIQAIDHHLQVSEFVSSDTVEVTGLNFQAGETLFNDFFNNVNLINIDSDEEPEVYGFKKRFWYNGGERPSSLRIFSFDDPDDSKDFVLDHTGDAPLISDFDLNGYADIVVNTGNCNWPQKPYASLFNIDETSEAAVFSESFTQLNIALDGNCGSGITNTNILVDIDQDGRDELITAAVNEWDQQALSLFAIESDDFDQNIILRPSGEDVYDWNGEDFDGVGALIKSKLDQSGKGYFIGLAHTYLDPDNDGDADHLIAVNMQKGNPLSALYFVESLGAGRVRAHYLNHFIDKSIIHLETVKDDENTTRVIISTSDDTNYWTDAYSTRFVKFLTLDITNSSDLFEEMFDATNAVVTDYIQPVNYKENDKAALTYATYEFDGITLANIFETGDINNDGLTDVIVVGSNSYDTWNASAILNVYLQNADGEFDPYVSRVSKGVKVFSFISSLNMIDINGDAQFDIVASGRLRNSNDGATIGFVNQTNASSPVTLLTPDQLAGQNNGYKVELNWEDANEGDISYAVQIGNELNDYNISLGKLNQHGFPLFPDRFKAFHPSTSLTFDAYDLADTYYFRIKAIDEYGNTSDFSEIQEVTLSQPFTLMDQSIPGLEEGGVAWGDYDRDGDLDLAIMGKEDGFTTAIYENDSGTFVNANQILQKQSKGDLEWVDFDNDGYLDLIVVGLNPQLLPSLNIYKNQNGVSFVRQTQAELPGLTDATLAFGDADADGDMDLVMAGIGEENGSIQYSFKLYTNRYNEGNGVIFELSPNFSYEGFVNGDIEFADLDNDGDLDIVYSGTGRGDSPVGGIIVNTRVGLSDNNSRYLYSYLLSLKNATISVGDIDLDGDLDLVTSGVSSNYNGVEENVIRILYNNSYRIDSLRAYINFRDEISSDITPLVDGDMDLTDFDNDGDLDILTSGADEFGNPQTLLYAQRSGDFFPVNAGFEHVSQSSVKWADFDTDGDMDVFISGKSGTISQTLLYENNTGNLINSVPSSPTNLQVTDYGFGKIKLSWDRAIDDYTGKTSLSYVIALGDESGKSTKFTTESNLETGYRLNPKPSSTLQNFLYLELDPGKYYFSVQAVDANYAGSEFSEEIAFDVTYIWKELNLGGIVDNSLPAGEDASVKFSDFDGDGDFDLAIFGKNPNRQWELGLLENKGGSFEKIYDFDPITKGDFDWADINGDGTLDLFMTGEDPYDETQVRANLYLNQTPSPSRTDSTYDGQFRWADGRLFEEDFITWQFQTPSQDHSYFAYGYLNGSNPPQIFDVAGSDQWWSGSALVEVPIDYSVNDNGIWRWPNGTRIQNYVSWGDGQPWIDQYAEGAYAVMYSNGIYPEPFGNGSNHPAILEIDTSVNISNDVLNSMYLVGSNGARDYYITHDYYSGSDIFENVSNYYPDFSLLAISNFDEWTWFEDNMNSFYGWTGLRVLYPSVDIENVGIYYQGIFRNKNYFRFDFYNGPNSAFNLVRNGFPNGSTLFMPDDQEELDYMINYLGNHGLIGVIRKGFPAGYQAQKANFQNSNLYFEPLVNAKVKFTDIDNNGTPELIYAGSTSSTSIGRPALKIYKFLEDGFNITQREVQLSQDLPNLTESSIEFGDIDKDRDIDIVLSGFDPFSGRRTIIFKNNGLDDDGRLELVEDTENELVGVQNGTIDLIDFDNDGDLDMVISGDSKTGDILEIYQNDEGLFSKLSASLGGLEAMKNGRTSWGDFNGDGYADILYSGDVLGKGEFTGLAVYVADSAAFLQDEFDLSRFANAAVAFGDYDDDDDLDMILTGTNKNYDEYDPGSERYISKLYVNVRNESALVVEDTVTQTIAFNPGGEAMLGFSPLNTGASVNQPPTVPVLNMADILEDTTSSGRRFVELSWNESVDDFTASAGLTYALRIGTSSGGNDILDAQANADGTRRVSGKGNVEHNTSWKISLDPGNYYWSVQALDASYSSSDFSDEKTFTLSEDGTVEINEAPIARDTTFRMRDVELIGYNVGTIEVYDPNEDELIFSILSGNSQEIFSIGQTTGILVLFDDTQFDTATTEYLLEILVSDGVLSDTANITIALEANQIPVIENQTFNISEVSYDGDLIDTLIAYDANNDVLSFEIVSGNDDGIFALSTTGELSIADASLLSSVDSVGFTVQVSDGFEYDQADISVMVSQNNPPEAQNLSFELNEDVNSGYEVGNVTASDPEGDEITYTIISGNEQGIFEIVDSTGQILVNDPAFIQSTTYNLTVDISDGFESISINVELIVKSLLGLDELMENIRIYPNPANDWINITLLGELNKEIVIRDISGKELIQFKTRNNSERVDISELRAGIYFMIIKMEGQNILRLHKIVKH